MAWDFKGPGMIDRSSPKNLTCESATSSRVKPGVCEASTLSNLRLSSGTEWKAVSTNVPGPKPSLVVSFLSDAIFETV